MAGLFGDEMNEIGKFSVDEEKIVSVELGEEFYKLDLLDRADCLHALLREIQVMYAVAVDQLYDRKGRRH